MLSYKHGYHAGNHADVLKHLVLTLVLQYTKQKDKPFAYIETHSGKGLYDLTSPEAIKNSEFNTGIGAIWNNIQTLDLSNPKLNGLKEYLEVIHKYNDKNKLETYPGSPCIAREILRDKDRLLLFELHNNEFLHLENLFKYDRKAKVTKKDGFDGLISVLPPIERRAVVLIDPSYELKADYKKITEKLKEANKRFATGTYLIWYPINKLNLAKEIKKDIKSCNFNSILQVELNVDLPKLDKGLGLTGSGMIIVNPPYILEQQLEDIMPAIHQLMSSISNGYNIKNILNK